MRPRTPMYGRKVCMSAKWLEEMENPKYVGFIGVIVGENRTRTSWKVKFEKYKYPIGLHKSFVEIIDGEES